MKRILAMICVLLSVVCCVAAMPVAAAKDAIVTAGTVTAKPGDTVTLPVFINEVENIGGIGLHVYYDGAALECVEATAQGIVAPMDMMTVNTEPAGATNEIWLTGISLNGIKGSGDILHITFKVKETAANGVAKVGFTEKGQELVSSVTVKAMPMSCVDGGVVISGGSDAPATTAAGGNNNEVTTTAKADAQPTDAQTTTAAQGDVTPQTDKKDDTSDVVIELEPLETPTSGTAADIDGAVITDAQGQPTMVQGVAVRVGKAVGKPGDVVTVAVDISEVTALTALGINVSYDTGSLKFEGGDAKGILADGMSMATIAERESGIVSISAVHSTGISGDGAVAYLRFRVKNNAKNGEHELRFATTPVLMSDLMTLPVSLYEGAVTVEGAKTVNLTAILIPAALIVLAGGAVLFVMWRRKQPAKPKAEKPVAKTPSVPAVTEIDDDGFEEE